MYPDVQKIIDVLQVMPEEEFNMSCPSTCIGGHCNILNNGRYRMGKSDGTKYSISKALNVPLALAYKLGFPDEDIYYYAKIPQVIKVLEHLRDNGEVDWKLSEIAQDTAVTL